MGEVLLKYRIMPNGPEVDVDALAKIIGDAMPDFAQLQKCEPVPFAFGMKALLTTVIVADEEGNNDKMETILGELDDVQGIELLDMGRL